MSCFSTDDVNDSFVKDPNASKDYDCDWSPANGPWLVPGDTIASAVWIVPDDFPYDPDRSGHTTTKTTVWILPGGEVGKSYEVTTRVTTAQGRIEDQTQTFYIENR